MKRIVVATDFSELARTAYKAAASLARAYDAKLELTHEVEALPPLYAENFQTSVEIERFQNRLDEQLNREVQHASFANVDVLPRLLYKGAAHGNLVDFARAEHVDLIVLSTHGRTGLSHSLLGSYTERVARHSTVPVLTYRSHQQQDEPFEPRTILVPFDLSENSKAVFPVVRQLHERFTGSVKFLHVLPEVSVRGDWGDAQERLRVSAETASNLKQELRSLIQKELPGNRVTVDSRYGDAYGEIFKEARVLSPDLIVMATHGWTGLKHFYFGSVAEKIIRTAPCSVLSVRPEKIQEDPSVRALDR